MYIHISLSDQKQHQIHTLSIQQFEYGFVGMKTSERLLWNHRFSSLRWFKIVSIQKKKIESVEYRWTIEMNYETMCIRMICSSTDCNNSINYLLKQHCFKFCFERCRFEWTCYTRMENAQNRINHTDTDIDNMFFLQNFKIIRGWPCMQCFVTSTIPAKSEVYFPDFRHNSGCHLSVLWTRRYNISKNVVSLIVLFDSRWKCTCSWSSVWQKL